MSKVQGNAGAFVLPRACLLLRPCPAVAFPHAHLEVSWHLPKGGSFVQTKHILSEGEQEKRNFGNILMENRFKKKKKKGKYLVKEKVFCG